MNELEKLLKTTIYGGIGAIATVVEKSGELLQSFVDKGEEVVRQGQTIADDAAKKFKEAWENAEMDFDVSRMTEEQREALRRRLEELEKAEREAVKAFNDALKHAEDAEKAVDEAGKRAMEAEDAYEAAREASEHAEDITEIADTLAGEYGEDCDNETTGEG